MANIEILIEQVRAFLIETEDTKPKHEIYNQFINECKAMDLTEDDFYKKILKAAHKSVDWEYLEKEKRESAEKKKKFEEALKEQVKNAPALIARLIGIVFEDGKVEPDELNKIFDKVTSLGQNEKEWTKKIDALIIENDFKGIPQADLSASTTKEMLLSTTWYNEENYRKHFAAISGDTAITVVEPGGKKSRGPLLIFLFVAFAVAATLYFLNRGRDANDDTQAFANQHCQCFSDYNNNRSQQLDAFLAGFDKAKYRTQKKAIAARDRIFESLEAALSICTTEINQRVEKIKQTNSGSSSYASNFDSEFAKRTVSCMKDANYEQQFQQQFEKKSSRLKKTSESESESDESLTSVEDTTLAPSLFKSIGTALVMTKRAYFHEYSGGTFVESQTFVIVGDQVEVAEVAQGYCLSRFVSKEGRAFRGWIRQADLSEITAPQVNDKVEITPLIETKPVNSSSMIDLNCSSSLTQGEQIFVVGDEVNIRPQPSKDYKEIGTVYRGERLSALGKHTDDRGVDWYQVNYYGKKGYISGLFTCRAACYDSSPERRLKTDADIYYWKNDDFALFKQYDLDSNKRYKVLKSFRGYTYVDYFNNQGVWKGAWIPSSKIE